MFPWPFLAPSLSKCSFALGSMTLGPKAPMSFGKTQPNSQDFSSHRRNSDHSDLSKDPASQNQLGLTTLVESVEAPDFPPSAFPNSASPWPFNTSRVPALENASLSSTFSTSLHPHLQDSTTSLHTTSSLPTSFYDHHDPSYSENSYSESYSEPSFSDQYTEPTDQPSFEDDNLKEQLPTEHPRYVSNSTIVYHASACGRVFKLKKTRENIR